MLETLIISSNDLERYYRFVGTQTQLTEETKKIHTPDWSFIVKLPALRAEKSMTQLIDIATLNQHWAREYLDMISL